MPSPTPEPDTAPVIPEGWDENQRVVAWECQQLLGLGFTIDQSIALSNQRHFSWHDAADFIKAHPNCPLDIVFDELLA